jgi:SAM-dependent methyltransferase
MPAEYLSTATREALQEDLYGFPYHHVPVWDESGFRHFRIMPSAYEYASYSRHVLNLLRSLSWRSLLDVGCGDGRMCAEVRRTFPHVTVAGVDPSQRAIAFARAFAPECDIVCGDIQSPDVLPETFDVVLLIEVLEHISPQGAQAFLAALGRRLAPCGTLILTVPSSNVQVSPKHYRHFDEGDLRAVLSPQFADIEITFLNRDTIWEWFVYRLMLNPFVAVTNRSFLRWWLRVYERRYLPAAATNCRRLLAVCRRKSAANDGAIKKRSLGDP